MVITAARAKDYMLQSVHFARDARYVPFPVLKPYLYVSHPACNTFDPHFESYPHW